MFTLFLVIPQEKREFYWNYWVNSREEKIKMHNLLLVISVYRESSFLSTENLLFWGWGFTPLHGPACHSIALEFSAVGPSLYLFFLILRSPIYSPLNPKLLAFYYLWHKVLLFSLLWPWSIKMRPLVSLFLSRQQLKYSPTVKNHLLWFLSNDIMRLLSLRNRFCFISSSAFTTLKRKDDFPPTKCGM